MVGQFEKWGLKVLYEASIFFNLIKREISHASRAEKPGTGSFNEVDAWDAALLNQKGWALVHIVKQPVDYAYLIEFVCVLMVSLSNLGDTRASLALKSFVYYYIHT